MTINIGLVTNEHVILGCDSVSSVTGWFLDPRNFVEKLPDGSYKVDDNGNYVATFAPSDLQQVVTDAWGGVTKMFCLCAIDTNPVAGVTSGLAHLNNRSISAIAGSFASSIANQNFTTVRAVVEKFVEYLAVEYETHNNGIPPSLRDDVEFLIGGFGASEQFPSLYRVNLIKPADSRIAPLYGEGAGFTGRSGIAWSGSADGVQRLILGYDLPLQRQVQLQAEQIVNELYESMSEAALQIVADVLGALGAQLPEGINTELPAKPVVHINWDQFQLPISFATLPLQSAVELVSYLVNLQSGKAKFVFGVPTVGGRTHVGLITSGGFRMLNEPELLHRNTGFDRDL